jgi:hypothetical protein
LEWIHRQRSNFAEGLSETHGPHVDGGTETDGHGVHPLDELQHDLRCESYSQWCSAAEVQLVLTPKTRVMRHADKHFGQVVSLVGGNGWNATSHEPQDEFRFVPNVEEFDVLIGRIQLGAVFCPFARARR